MGQRGRAGAPAGAEVASHPDDQRRNLNFVIVGGGPTGVEMAGAIAELAHKALAADFRNINPKGARIILIEAGDRLLSAFPFPFAFRRDCDSKRPNAETERPEEVRDGPFNVGLKPPEV